MSANRSIFLHISQLQLLFFNKKYAEFSVASTQKDGLAAVAVFLKVAHRLRHLILIIASAKMTALYDL